MLWDIGSQTCSDASFFLRIFEIYKGKGGSDSIANYRPISVTNCFIKILEKIIFKHLHNYLLRYIILSDDQSGFRHRDSTI